MKLFSWNVNGIRSAQKQGFEKWFEEQSAEIICLQEIKATPEQLDMFLLHPKGYHSFWHPAEKPGYSGVAVYSKKEPLSVKLGMGDPRFDCEGRVIVAEYSDFFLINAYFPNSQRDHARLDYKLSFCEEMLKLCGRFKAKGKSIVLCGDYNIAHQEIDLRNPKSNENNAGFLPQERAWMTKFLSSGYNDIFRKEFPDPHRYTWWSYRPGVRERNIGWRIDYHCVNEEFVDRVRAVGHQPEVTGSDHCPVYLRLKA